MKSQFFEFFLKKCCKTFLAHWILGSVGVRTQVKMMTVPYPYHQAMAPPWNTGYDRPAPLPWVGGRGGGSLRRGHQLLGRPGKGGIMMAQWILRAAWPQLVKIPKYSSPARHPSAHDWDCILLSKNLKISKGACFAWHVITKQVLDPDHENSG